MRKSILFLAGVLSMFFVLSCSDDDSSDSSNTSGTSIYIKFKVNGEQVNLVGDEDVYVANSLAKAIIGDDYDNSTYIRLFVPLDVVPGTYNITGGAVDDYTASYEKDGYATDNESGTITISEVNENIISGTFSFTADLGDETVNITEGKFRAENVE